MYWLIVCPYTNLEVMGAIGRALSVHSLVRPNRVILILGRTRLESRKKLEFVVKATTVLKRFSMTRSIHLDIATQLHLVLQRFSKVGRCRMILLHSKLVVIH